MTIHLIDYLKDFDKHIVLSKEEFDEIWTSEKRQDDCLHDHEGRLIKLETKRTPKKSHRVSGSFFYATIGVCLIIVANNIIQLLSCVHQTSIRKKWRKRRNKIRNKISFMLFFCMFLVIYIYQK